MNPLIEERIAQRKGFFADKHLRNYKRAKNISLVIVVHMIESSIAYVQTLDKYFSLEYIIPKPNSIDKKYTKLFPQDKILKINREQLKTPHLIMDYLKRIPPQNKIVLVDIGGYFSKIGNDIKKQFGDRFMGIIEDTENGYQKYLRRAPLDFPLLSVARSPLKDNEDHLVGQSVVFSTDAILREQGVLLNNKRVGVIGFGKIGTGILSYLTDKGCHISVYDTNPIALVIANARGNGISTKDKIIQESEIIFCATGNLALKGEEFKYLKKGAFVASVTSSDDEMDTRWLENKYEAARVSDYITRYFRRGHYFYMLHKGNAINFVHGGGIDNFIVLVQKEMIESALYLAEGKGQINIQESPNEMKKNIATRWLKHFLQIDLK